MSRCKLRTPWPIHFKLRTVIGIDSLTVCILFGKLKTPWSIHFKLRIGIGIVSLMVCILFGEISIFHFRVMGLYSSNSLQAIFCMSRCKLRTPWPIHIKLLTIIGIGSLTVCILFGEIQIFHSRVYGKESLYKYCMNVDDGRIMRTWRSCLFLFIIISEGQG